ncbi:hypothetical protein B6U74_01895 [Candidatus Bathyarchaeota archaeon ex4484_205]|nr:MAG: hypothetical protein B6U74_01895 [Candidatus Bathyarchaeota archaeon ex4484_205]
MTVWSTAYLGKTPYLRIPAIIEVPIGGSREIDVEVLTDEDITVYGSAVHRLPSGHKETIATLSVGSRRKGKTKAKVKYYGGVIGTTGELGLSLKFVGEGSDVPYSLRLHPPVTVKIVEPEGTMPVTGMALLILIVLAGIMGSVFFYRRWRRRRTEV